MKTPILILSDAPTANTGLGRITRDVATRIHANMGDVFECGTIGYGGSYSRSLGFPQYTLDMHEWVAFNLPEVWRDFTGDRKGILLTIWDSSRLRWLTHPETCPDPRLKKFLISQPFEKWAYLPIDATGPHDRLTGILKNTIEGFDRALAYSQWAHDILRRTLHPAMDLDWVPHGIDTSVFFPRHRVQARHSFGARINAKYVKGKRMGQFVGIPDDAFFIGIVATNQIRKDWAWGLTTVAELAKERNTWVWIHTDEMERHFSIPALLNDFNLSENAIVTIAEFTDEQMAWCYSACDCTIAIGLGEGFGFSAAESLACGVPAVAPDYGGGEFIPTEFLVKPMAYRMEGPYNCIRPVMSAKDAASVVRKQKNHHTFCPDSINWNGPTLWKRWEEWLRKGLPNEPDGILRGDTELERVAGVLPELEGHSK
jgi:glycosyltransferase involved in cell wall biosynthesis